MADRKISDLTALTTPATGDLIPIVDISEAAAADKNKSITVGELLRGAPDGTAAAPGFAFESDGGNGMFLGGTDILAFSTGGSQAVTIDASQRLGVGTGSPDQLLDVAGTARFGGSTTKLTTYSDSTYSGFFNGSSLTSDESIYMGGGGTFFYNDGSPSVAINSSGRLGIGTTSPNELLEVRGTNDQGIRITSTAGSGEGANLQWYSEQTGDNKITAEIESDGQGTGGNLQFKTRTTAGTLTEAVRIDNAQRFLVGTSTQQGDHTLQIQGDASSVNAAGSIYLRRGLTTAQIGANVGADLGDIQFGANDGTIAGRIECLSDATWSSTSDTPGRLVFSTTADGASSPTERVRILANGFVKAKNDGGTFPTGAVHEFSSDENIYVTFRAENKNNLSGSGTYNSLLGSNCDNTGSFHFVGNTGGADRVYIYGNGNIVNSNNSYGLMSDVKLKENIVDANSQWDDLKALRVVNFNFKEETGYQTHTQIGFIAQEVEQVSPGLVYETPDLDIEGNNLGTVTKVLQSSVLYTKAVKALQEAMERIEQLEAKVAALEAQ